MTSEVRMDSASRPCPESGDAEAARTTIYAPLLLCGGFFLFTILLAAFGPIRWDIEHPAVVYGFLGSCLVALILGYLIAVRRHRRSQVGATRARAITANTVVMVGSAAFLLLYVPVVNTTIGKWYPDVWTGITNPGLAYDRKICLAETASQTWTYLSMLAGPLTLPILPVTLFLFKDLKLPARVLGITCIVLDIALGVAQAVNKNIAEICASIVLILVFIAVSLKREHRLRNTVLCIAGAAVSIGLFGVYYDSTLSSRISQDLANPDAASCTAKMDDGHVDEPEVTEALQSGARLNAGTERTSSAFYKVVPKPVQPIGVKLTSYLTQGYQGLAYSMEGEFRPTWGLGFSQFYRHNLLRVVGQSAAEESIEARTYPGQAEETYGWSTGARWSSFFVHPASDLTFFGVIGLLGLIGYAFGLSWMDTLKRRDPVACTVFFHLCILVFYLSANNQLFQTGRLAIGFTVLLLAWLLLRRHGPLTHQRRKAADAEPQTTN